ETTRSHRSMRRILLALAAAVAALLVVEGALSLGFGRSLRPGARRPLPGVSALFAPSVPLPSSAAGAAGKAAATAPDDPLAAEAPASDDGAAATLANSGPWWMHIDPLVGITLRHDKQLALPGCTIQTDDLGLRDDGPPPGAPSGGQAAQQLRVVVLGGA